MIAAYIGVHSLYLLHDVFVTEISIWPKEQNIIFLISVSLIIFIVIYYINPIVVTRSIPESGLSWNIQIDEHGIMENSPQEDIMADWSMFSGVLETREDILLFRGRAGYRFYPKRKIDPDTLTIFKEMIHKNISQIKNPGRGRDNTEMTKNNEFVSSEIASSRPSKASVARDSDTSGMLKFRLILNKDDYKRAYRIGSRKIRNIMIASIISYLLYKYIYDSAADNGIISIIISAMPLIIAFFMFWLYYYIRPIVIARSAPDVGVVFDIDVSDAGIGLSSGTVNSRLGWDNFKGATETSKDFVLFRGGAFFNAYPKRMFANPHDIGRFRDLIRANVPNAKLLN